MCTHTLNKFLFAVNEIVPQFLKFKFKLSFLNAEQGNKQKYYEMYKYTLNNILCAVDKALRQKWKFKLEGVCCSAYLKMQMIPRRPPR